MTTASIAPTRLRHRPAAGGPSGPSTGSSEDDRNTLFDAFSPAQFKLKNVDWVVTIFLVGVHVAALAAPFFFSWTAVIAALALHWLTCSIGICLGYHRYLAHKSFKLRKPAEFVALACGVISGEGSPLRWSATHRLHHQRSDQHGDPHSPTQGPWWSHFLWLFVHLKTENQDILYRRYVPELVDQPIMQFFERTFALWLWGFGAALFGVGYAIDGWWMGGSMVLWAMCVRLVVAYHSTWFVNSATHIWGYRNYDTRDVSRNLWWVAILSYGEGWHNNHHAHPSVAPAGHRWWEIDMTWWSIRALRTVGLAYDVRDRIPVGREAADA